jgi:hypothetical protein
MTLKDDNLRFTVLKAIADAVDDEMRRLRDGHLSTLLERYDDEGTTSFEVRLPGSDAVVAKLSLGVPKDKLEHTDPAAFEAWLEKNHPDAVIVEHIDAEPERTVVLPATPARVEKFIDPKALSAVMKHFKVTPGGVVDTATGVVVDGVENVPGGRPKSFSVRYEADGRDLITQSYRDGKLNGIVAGGPLPAIDEPVIERRLVVAPDPVDEVPVAPPVDQEPIEPTSLEEALGDPLPGPVRYGAEQLDQLADEANVPERGAFGVHSEGWAPVPAAAGEPFDPGDW